MASKIMESGPITSWQIDKGEKWKQWQILFSWAPKSLQQMVTAAMKDNFIDLPAAVKLSQCHLLKGLSLLYTVASFVKD